MGRDVASTRLDGDIGRSFLNSVSLQKLLAEKEQEYTQVAQSLQELRAQVQQCQLLLERATGSVLTLRQLCEDAKAEELQQTVDPSGELEA